MVVDIGGGTTDNRGHFAERHRVFALGAHGRQSDGRSHHDYLKRK